MRTIDSSSPWFIALSPSLWPTRRPPSPQGRRLGLTISTPPPLPPPPLPHQATEGICVFRHSPSASLQPLRRAFFSDAFVVPPGQLKSLRPSLTAFLFCDPFTRPESPSGPFHRQIYDPAFFCMPHKRPDPPRQAAGPSFSSSQLDRPRAGKPGFFKFSSVHQAAFFRKDSAPFSLGKIPLPAEGLPTLSSGVLLFTPSRRVADF